MGSKSQSRRLRCIFMNKACRVFPCEAMHTCVSTTQNDTRPIFRLVYQYTKCLLKNKYRRRPMLTLGFLEYLRHIYQYGLKVYFCLLRRTQQIWVQSQIQYTLVDCDIAASISVSERVLYYSYRTAISLIQIKCLCSTTQFQLHPVHMLRSKSNITPSWSLSEYTDLSISF